MLGNQETAFTVKSRRGELRPALAKTSELVLGTINPKNYLPQGSSNTKPNFGATGEYAPTYVPRQRGDSFRDTKEFFNKEISQTQASFHAKKDAFSSQNQQQQPVQDYFQNTNSLLNTGTSINDYELTSTSKQNPSELKKLLPPRIRNGQVKESPQVKEDNAVKTQVQKENIFSSEPTQTKQSLLMKDQFDLREQALKEKFQIREKEKQEQERQEQIERDRKRSEQKTPIFTSKPFQTSNQQQQQFSEPTSQWKKEETLPSITNNNNIPPQLPPSDGKKKKVIEELGAYMPNTMEASKNTFKARGGRSSSNQGQEPVKVVVNTHEEKLAVATGVEEAPLEESQQDDQELVPCPEGCGRSFNKKALEKHAVACRKVFQSKRNEFNATQKRLVDQDQAKLQRQGKIKEKLEKKSDKKEMKSTQKNWKEQSEELRKLKKKNQQQQQQQEQQQE